MLTKHQLTFFVFCSLVDILKVGHARFMLIIRRKNELSIFWSRVNNWRTEVSFPMQCSLAEDRGRLLKLSWTLGLKIQLKRLLLRLLCKIENTHSSAKCQLNRSPEISGKHRYSLRALISMLALYTLKILLCMTLDLAKRKVGEFLQSWKTRENNEWQNDFRVFT